MATQSLYRRYRPRRFAELKGQDHVVRALRDAVASGREGQAYLFSGPRGTGKTTSARILAKVLNCEAPTGGEPCCKCESCLAVERGSSYDVHELDAASNNGVDAMRDLIEKASLGTPGRHKVYILDEVHMLSRAAEAALLKTLEEPPQHVVFVLATTDPQKVSDTIRSRTQHLQFHLFGADELLELVRQVTADAGLDVSEHAIDVAVARGAGSPRDALSALELIATAGESDDGGLSFDDLVEALADGHQGRALAAVATAMGLGRDPRTLTEELIRHLRDGFLSLMAPELVQLPSGRVDELADRANRLGAAALVRGIEVLGEMLVEMRHAPDPRLLLEVALVRLCRPESGGDVAALSERLERVEHAVDALASAPAPAAGESSSSGRGQLGGRARRPAASEPAPPAESEREPVTEPAPAAAVTESSADASVTAEKVQQVWQADVQPALKPLVRALYAAGSFTGSTTSDGRFVYELPNEHHRGKCVEHLATVESALTAAAGGAVSLALTVPGAEPAPPPPEAEHDIDVDELVDAPPGGVATPLDRLADAFPGSELVTDTEPDR